VARAELTGVAVLGEGHFSVLNNDNGDSGGDND
jgi:hypothetical protein